MTQRTVVIPYRRFGTTSLIGPIAKGQAVFLQGQEVKEQDFFNLEDRTDRLSRNVGTELRLDAA
jgi:hypothetical protein